MTLCYNMVNLMKGEQMTDTKIAKHFNMPLRTYSRFKKAEQGSWRKRIYYLMIEEMLRLDKLKG